MSYTPQPGTIAAKVIEYLRTQPPGTVIATAPLLEAIGHSELRFGLRPFMEASIEAGLVQAEKRPDDRLVYWRVGDGVPVVRPADDDDQSADSRPAARPTRKRSKVDGASASPGDALLQWLDVNHGAGDCPTCDEIQRFGLGFGVGVAVRMAERAMTAPPDQAKALLIYACVALGRAAVTVNVPLRPDETKAP